MHTPEKRAQAVADLIAGDGWDAVAKRHGVSKSTLSKWFERAKGKASREDVALPKPSYLPVGEPARKDRFDESLKTFLLSTIDMLQAWSEHCSDKAFLKENPHGAHELGRTVLERADLLVSVLKPGGQPRDGDAQ